MDPITLGILGGSMLGQGVGSWLQADAQRDAARESAKEQRLALDKMLGYQVETADRLQEMYQPYVNQGMDAFRDYASYDPTTEMGDFQYTKDVNQFLDPSMQYQQDQARRQIEASNAASGGLGGGAFAKELQDRAMNIAQQGYGDAYNRMQNDKSFAYQNFLNKFNAASTNNQLRRQQLQNIAQTGMSGLNTQAQAVSGLGQQQAQYAGNMGNVDATVAGANQMYGGSGMAGNMISAFTNPQAVATMYNAFNEQ